LFIGWVDQSALVLKGSSTVMSDIFALRVSTLLGLQSTDYHIIWYKGQDGEFERIEKKIG